MAKCPVCRQLLPKALDNEELRVRLEAITARARTQQKQTLETEFRKRLPRLLEEERERARRSAEHEVKHELLDAKKRADKAERDKNREIERIRKEAERTAERRAEMAAKSVATQNQAQIENYRRLARGTVLDMRPTVHGCKAN